ncbi:SMP-30/gluconolactonase/LRE family protein [Burkholderia cenocepacia]|uniref:SMP-30/gluconolactonase/LRE family protein n=1 Tax=Burkholderia cenocepacia TaxID=95486 RepID=UPI001B9FB0B3|nr:SMP-30/gluconolactonase/LRE family protein [Burkholderia cenocepacia]MBR8030148.1 SMP-30/gluconolactonase/LRE family protein [Burkholderia cenocepacia]MBR8174026.1 SMP-30/gluconolactonase/LRE family protein [Burkholderia cenocepacia]
MDNNALFPKNAKLEQVFSDGFHTEGPAEAPDGRIFFCDITVSYRTSMTAGVIWVFDPRTDESSIFRSPSGMASGIAFDHEGNMLVAGGADFGMRSVISTNMKTGRSRIVAGLYGGQPLNSPNDLAVDRAGGIYFTDPRYMGHEPVQQPVFGVYYVSPFGDVRLLLADVSKPNGIALSPDQRVLYVVEHDIRILDRRHAAVAVRDIGEMRILAYDVIRPGELGNQRVFVDFGNEKGADGITVDSHGNVYAAVQSLTHPGVRVYDPAGRMIASIPIPERPSNVTITRKSAVTYMYVTATTSLYRIPCLLPSGI